MVLVFVGVEVHSFEREIFAEMSSLSLEGFFIFSSDGDGFVEVLTSGLFAVTLDEDIFA